MAALNQRHYSQSVENLEQELRNNPRDISFALMVVMAHLGNANAEMMQTIAAVMSKQGNPPPQLLEKVKCGDEPWDNLQNKSANCLMARILRQVPESHNADIDRAQQLLREYFPDPKSTSANQNFLAAYVEIYQALIISRLLTSPAMAEEALALKLKSGDLNDPSGVEFEKADKLFHRIVKELKAFLDDIMQFFRRLKYSYSKVANYTASIDGKPLVEYKGHQLVFDENMDSAKIARFAVEVLEDEKGAADSTLNHNFSGALSRLAPRLIRHARQLGYAAGPAQVMDKLESSLHFERLITKTLKGVAGKGRLPADTKQSTQEEMEAVATKLWQVPPGIFGDLASALRASWDQESLRPAFEYHQATREDWVELGNILTLWNKVADNYNHTKAPDGPILIDILAKRRAADPNYLRFPEVVTLSSVHSWFHDLIQEADKIATDYLSGRIPGIQEMTPERKALVRESWTRTKAWMEKNLFAERAPR